MKVEGGEDRGGWVGREGIHGVLGRSDRRQGEACLCGNACMI